MKAEGTANGNGQAATESTEGIKDPQSGPEGATTTAQNPHSGPAPDEQDEQREKEIVECVRGLRTAAAQATRILMELLAETRGQAAELQALRDVAEVNQHLAEENEGLRKRLTADG